MTANDQIAELNRQRAEKHRLIDEEYDRLIHRIRSLCTHELDDTLVDYDREFWGYYCMHCGADMSAQST